MGSVKVVVEWMGHIEAPSDKCPQCEGRGYDWECMDCNGDGCLPSGNDCPTCYGTGLLDDPKYSYGKTTCEYCGGTGKREDCEAEYERRRALALLKLDKSVVDLEWVNYQVIKSLATRGVI